ncbi:trans-resveratrol di-O-methyltransferase-like [Iris pallida]|uniref:Trans-resveratrol di-O-methyltransferase-like n=1 Tax=Iris pallida TaxID=29817 RepID=A0AAX6GIV7_IRIPA|nr:trans-resveratrol di-O-methyltransferase-like [Iris pallida]
MELTAAAYGEGKGRGSDELLQSQTLLWSQIFSYIDSMALKCAVELGIPDAIHSHGPHITLAELMSSLSLSPTKTPHMRRLMRMLTHSRIFTSSQNCNGGEGYSLTPLSELLVDRNKNKGTSCQNGFVLTVLHPVFLNSFQSMSDWFRGNEDTPFSVAHGCGFWDMTDRDPEFNRVFNEGMACDAQFLMDALLKDCGHVFQGLESLMDVGGGTGSAAIAVSKVFPEVKCSVLELQQVVDTIHNKGEIDFIPGDMFEYIPPANAILLKCVLHDWGDRDCVKILQRCKEAIPSKENGGKVIIIDLVVGNDTLHQKSMRTQLYFDVTMMVMCGGVERGEEEWKNVFMEAGFTDYNITPVGLRSIIEVYP